jgi:hypothetical protein
MNTLKIETIGENLMKKSTAVLSVCAWALMSVNALAGAEGTTNTFYGMQAGNSASSNVDKKSTFIGYRAGYLWNDEGAGENTFVGWGSGRNTRGDSSTSNDAGSHNSFFGTGSGLENTTGQDNTFVGYIAGNQNTTGNFNVFVGSYSGHQSTTGKWNTFIGANSGVSNTTGQQNVFSGHASGAYNTGGSQNTFVGHGSGYNNTTGGRNTALGYGALVRNQMHSQNVAIGWSAGYSCKSDFNVFIGDEAGYQTTSGEKNVMIGDNAGKSNRVGAGNTFIGTDSGNSADVNNSVLIGYSAGYNATRDYTLYIENSKSDSPLIYGEFDTNLVRINGDFEVTGTVSPLVVTGTVDTNDSITGTWSGSRSTGDGTKRLLELKANNSAAGKVSDAGFNLENTKAGFSWTFRTIEDTQGFAANKKGTGGAEFEVRNPTSDYSNVELAAGGVVFFKNGHLVNTSGQELATLIAKQNETMVAMQTKLEAKEQQIAALQKDQRSIRMEYDALVIAQNERDNMLAAKETEMAAMKAEYDAKFATQQKEIAAMKAMQARLARLETILANVAAADGVRSTKTLSMNAK